MSKISHPNRQRSIGLSLVELMVGMAIGLVVLVAITALFVGNSRTRQESEKTSQQIENGRYAIQVLSDDLRLAGHFGEFNLTELTSTTTTLPSLTAYSGAELASAIELPIQGYHNAAPTELGGSGVLADIRDNTDVLVVRRASSCIAGSTGCSAADFTKGIYFQTSLCANQLAILPVTSQFVIGSDEAVFKTSNPGVTGAASPPAYLANAACSAPAALRSLFVRVYFVANNNRSGDGIPTLKVAELGPTGFPASPGASNPLPLVEGVESLQIQYGIDKDGDGAPDVYTPTPAVPSTLMTAMGVSEREIWRRVTAVRLNVLARNSQASGGFSDTRTYVLGTKADGSANVFGPYGDNIKRHAYSTVIRLNNVAGRLE